MFTTLSQGGLARLKLPLVGPLQPNNRQPQHLNYIFILPFIKQRPRGWREEREGRRFNSNSNFGSTFWAAHLTPVGGVQSDTSLPFQKREWSWRSLQSVGEGRRGWVGEGLHFRPHDFLPGRPRISARSVRCSQVWRLEIFTSCFLLLLAPPRLQTLRSSGPTRPSHPLSAASSTSVRGHLHACPGPTAGWLRISSVALQRNMGTSF